MSGVCVDVEQSARGGGLGRECCPKDLDARRQMDPQRRSNRDISLQGHRLNALTMEALEAAWPSLGRPSISSVVASSE